MTGATTSAGLEITYDYNGEGLRVLKTSNGKTVRYLYEGDKVILEVDGNGVEKARSVNGINQISRTISGEVLYYMYNGHADVTKLTNTLGEDEKLSTLSREVCWSSNLHIISKCKTREEREFYLCSCIKERYSVRELERQIDSCFYERNMLSDSRSLQVPTVHEKIKNIFRDSYMMEFLDLPEGSTTKWYRCIHSRCNAKQFCNNHI